MGHREGHLSGRNGLSIYWQAWLPDGAPAAGPTLVIAHGLGEHGSRYLPLAEYLIERGSAVYVIDHRGHGRSQGPRAFVDRFANAVADLDQLIDLARNDRPAVPLFLLGHSLGGAIALDYALEHQAKLDGLILSAPAVAIDGQSRIMIAIGKVLSSLAPSLGVYSVDPSTISRDKAQVAAYVSDPLVLHGKAPARTIAELIHFVEGLPARLHRLSLPLLIIHGGADVLTQPIGSQRVHDGVASGDKTLRIYEGLFHEMFNELPADRARVLADLWRWIEDHGGAAAAHRAAGAGRAPLDHETAVYFPT